MAPISLAQLEISQVLLEHGYYMTTAEIARKVGISWNTADKYLNQMKDKKWIAHKKVGNRMYWRGFRK